MSAIVIGGIIVLLVIGAAMLQATARGRAETKADQAQTNAEAMGKYEEIDSKSPVDNPFSHMKGKK